jgi:transposase-like protein
MPGGRKRRRFTDDDRRMAVRMVLAHEEAGLTRWQACSRVAKSLPCSHRILTGWLKNPPPEREPVPERLVRVTYVPPGPEPELSSGYARHGGIHSALHDGYI